MFRHVHLIDTSIGSDNVGDEIIVSETRPFLERTFSGSYISTSSGHDGLGAFSRKLVEDADIAVLMGTNALAPHHQRRHRFIWTIERQDIARLAGKVVLCGVGANKDFETIHPKQARLLGKLLSDDHTHSVRDGLGGEILDRLGKKWINTSCPTLWQYAKAPVLWPDQKPDRVVFTLTKHKPSDADVAMIAILQDAYREVYFWPQQPRDLEYLGTLTDSSTLKIIPPTLSAYDALLADAPIDVIGTRLHGSIRGLRHKRRVLAIAIDNRAREIGGETGLPVLARSDVENQLTAQIAAGWPSKLAIKSEPIRAYLDQFCQ